MTEKDRRIENLSPDKLRALVGRIREKKQAAAAAHEKSAAEAPPRRQIPRAGRPGPFPLTFAQERLWFLYQFDPLSTAYNMPSAVRLSGPLDAAALTGALAEVVRRHGSLRTTFHVVGSGAVQVVEEKPPHVTPMADLRALPDGVREAEARRLLHAESMRPFDLARSPFRSLLVRVKEREHLLLAALHHIVSDGWSQEIVMREMAFLYGALAAKEVPALPPPALQYTDFAVWQRETFTGQVLREQLDYWRKRLTGAPPAIELPLERPRPPVQTSRGATVHAFVPPDVTAAFSALTREIGGTTMFMVLLAAFDALLARYSGELDLVVGTPVAGRTHAEIEGVVGFFLNTVALRADLTGDPRFRDLLSQVRDGVLADFSHQDLPFERILEAINPERDLSRTAVFQVMFNWLGFGPPRRGDVVQSDLTFGAIDAGEPVAKLDLELYAEELHGGVALTLLYNADLFSQRQMEGMARHLVEALRQVSGDPDARVSALLRRAASGGGAMLNWLRGGVGTPFGAAASLASRFAKTVVRHTEETAVRAGEEAWTYGELAARTARVAAALVTRERAADERVALLFRPGLPMVAAIFGCLAVGKTYVPLDPSYPPERLRFVAADAAASWLLFAPELEEKAAELAGGTGAVLLSYADLGEPPAGFSPRPVPAEALAYLLYTSGSTGQPKGVMQSHANVLAHTNAYARRLGLGPGDRLTLLPSYSFDAAVMDLYGALLAGAELCLWDLAADGLAGLPRFVRERGITVWHSTPTVFRAFAEAVPAGESFPGLRLVVLGGEEATARDLTLWRRLAPEGGRLINGLGPTESTLALQHIVERGDEVERASLPAGRAVEHVSVLLDNPAGVQMAHWGVGEIAVRGANVALGYWRRPDLTAAAFVPDPEGGAQRSYRTGDLGRLLPDGSIEFVGRRDLQVKVRGVRVELAEIEAVLAGVPAVRQAVVLALADGAGTRLVAFLAAHSERAEPGSEAPPTPAELRDFVAARLPPAFVPSAFVWLDAFPLTPTSKVDRRALAALAPAGEASLGAAQSAAPRDAIEEALLEVFREVLARTSFGIHDNFFDLGGHSLAAARAVSRVRAALGVELPLRTIFESPTVAALSAPVREALAGERGRAVPPLVAEPALAEEPAPLSFAQRRLWFLDRLTPGSSAYNLPIAVELAGDLDLAALRETFAEIVRRHATLRSAFPLAPGEDEPQQVVLPAEGFTLPLVDLSRLGDPADGAGAAALCLAAEDAGRPFDLAVGPLFRPVLLRLAPARFGLLATLHHTIADAWSLGVLVGEIGALYPAFAARRPSPLPPLPVTYADFSRWQRRWLSGLTLESELAFWRDELAGLPPQLELPTDRPRPHLRTYRAGFRPFALGAELSRRVHELAASSGATPFMVLLAAFQLLLGRLAGQEELAVGTAVAGRNRVEVEGLIGLFVNTLVLAVRLGGDPEFGDLVARVRSTTLGAYARQDLPFEKLVEELAPERHLSRTPLFQVTFVLQNAPQSGIEAPGIAISPLGGEGERAAKFDLNLALGESAAGFGGGLEYDSDLFEAVTLDRWLGFLGNLIAAATAAPERRLSELPLLSAAELAELRAEAYPEADFPVRSLADLFAERVAENPEAPAVVWGGLTLSYADLDRAAGRMAARLREAGLSPGEVVALALPRSVAAVVAIVGVIQSGGVYMPLDVDAPEERLVFQMADAGAVAVVVTPALAEKLGEEGPRRIVVMPEELVGSALAGSAGIPAGLFSEEPAGSRRSQQAFPESPAYVLYTSGSTGQPKGVVIPHRGVSHMVLASPTGFGPGDRVAQLGNLAFDASTWEIWSALLNGACLVGMEREVALSPKALSAAFAEQGVTAALLTTALFHQVAREAPEALSPLRLVLFGGEAAEGAVVSDLLEALTPSVPLSRDGRGGSPPPRLMNAYGPTEITVYSSLHEVTDLAPEALGVPIGRAFGGVRQAVLDPGLSPQPEGVPGELYVGGPGLALGYLGRPELTAERFVPDPVSGLAGERLYRTGDRVRRQGGVLEFVGRVDAQVKIRGRRIEPGEIEATLALHPEVSTAAVVVDEPRPGEKRLVAFAAPRAEDEGLDPAALAAFASRTLPAYMVPAAWVVLPRLPLTANGKLDRKALARLAEGAGAAASGVHRPPVSPAEQAVAAVWAEVLKREEPGLDDNFFGLGGHSLLAASVVSRLERDLEVAVPLAALFEEPTLEGFARRVAAAVREGSQVAGPPFPTGPRPAEIPLSYAQQRLWFLDRLLPGSPVYNVPLALPLGGEDAPAVAAVLEGLYARHEVLRTRFPEGARGPVQGIEPEATASVLAEIDLTALPPPAAQREALARAAAFARRPFDLAHETPVRACLVALRPEEKHLLVTFHHIAIDAASIDVLAREAGVLAEALATGNPSPLPPPPLQNADFALWQQAWVESGALAGELDYWRDQLAELPELALPYDHPRPAIDLHLGETLTFRLGSEVAAGLHALCRAANVTPFLALLTANAALLGRLSGSTDVPLGTPVANRGRAELEEVVGFFLNTLVLRADLTGEPTGREALLRVRDMALAAFAHQNLPFERLVEELRPDRSLSHNPLFSVLFVAHPPQATVPSEEKAPPGTGSAKFDLSFFYWPGETAIAGSVELNRGLFERVTVERMIGQLGRLLAGFVAHPEAPLAALPLLSEAETHQVTAEGNDSAAAYGEALWPVHRWFERQAALKPEVEAVRFAGEALTYRELAVHARVLAARLRQLGIAPGKRVGLFVSRSLDMAVAVLAALEAGAAYVPLDPEHPAERLAYLVESALAGEGGVLLAQAGIAGRIAEVAAAAGVPVVEMGEGSPRPLDGGEGPHPLPDDLAYVLYTSGSTGRPKGVGLPHRALSNLLAWHLAHLAGGVRTLCFASLGFDVSFYEMFLAWGSGGTLVVVPEDVRRDPQALARLIEEEQVEKAILPVVVLQQLAEEWNRGAGLPRALFELTTTGERLVMTPPVVELFARAPWARLHNHYGPTESHVVTAWPLPADPADWPALPPIGWPVANSRVYVVEPGFVPVGLGVVGELFLAGDCLARGYVGRPELTAERFVPDPLGGVPGARLYKTGDRARWLPGGALDYLGRADQQVKIRGFRVEPGEVEVALARHPAVAEAAVVVRSGRLVAYYAAGNGFDPGAAELRTFLKASLPDYMVPSAFVPLAELPLNRNGKVDRRALAENGPEPVFTGAGEGYTAPRTPAEELVAAAWSEVLGVPLTSVGIHDNFFDLGGHSLLATQVASRLREAFGVDVPLRLLFETRTLAALAQEAEEAGRSGRGVAAPPIRPVPRHGDLPLSFAQEWMWYIDQLDPTGQAFGSPIHVRLGGDLDVPAFGRALSEVIRRHEVLRTVFPQEGGRPVQRILPPAPLPLPLVDLSGLAPERRDEAASRLASQQFRLRMDLARGPLVRAVLVRRQAGEHTLVMTVHHIHFDGWSAGILLSEMAALYGAFAEGLSSPLPPLAVQVGDFAVWQRGWLTGEPYAALLDYWRRQLGEETPELALPGARQEAVTSLRSARVELGLPPAVATAARALARQSNATVFAVLLAGWKALLARTARTSRIPVGTPIANRNRAEIEGLIGYFVNTLVMSTDLSGNPGFTDLVARVREVALDAYAHQDMPFTRLIEELRPNRAQARTPFFQVLFLLQNVPMKAIELPGLSLAGEGSDVPIATFDLSLVLTELGEGGGIAGVLWYNRDLFEGGAVADLAERYRVLLEGALENPGAPLSELPLLTAEERGQLVSGAPAVEPVAAEGVGEESLYQLFAARAEEDPGAVAVVSAEGETTYGELAGRVGGIARKLEESGLAAGERVTLALRPSVELVAACLAVALVGGVAVAEADGAPWRLTSSGLEAVDRGGEAPPGEGAAPSSEADLDELRLDDRDVWALWRPSTAEIWGAFRTGGALAVIEGGNGGASLADELSRLRATVLYASAGLLADLAGLENPQPWRSLRWVLVDGEASAEAVAGWVARYGDKKPRLVRRDLEGRLEE